MWNLNYLFYLMKYLNNLNLIIILFYELTKQFKLFHLQSVSWLFRSSNGVVIQWMVGYDVDVIITGEHKEFNNF